MSFQYYPRGNQRPADQSDDQCSCSGGRSGSENGKGLYQCAGDEKSQQDTIAGLRSAEGFIRRSLAKSVNLRNTPEIKFVLDQSIEYGIHMSKMIDEVTKDIKEKPDEEA